MNIHILLLLNLNLKLFNMKTLLTLLFALCMLTSNAQYSKHRRDKTSHPFGTGFVVGGLSILTISLTTAPIYDWSANNSSYNSGSIPANQSGTYKQQPFMKQGARSYGIITGVTFTVTGLITMLTGN